MSCHVNGNYFGCLDAVFSAAYWLLCRLAYTQVPTFETSEYCRAQTLACQRRSRTVASLQPPSKFEKLKTVVPCQIVVFVVVCHAAIRFDICFGLPFLGHHFRIQTEKKYSTVLYEIYIVYCIYYLMYRHTFQ